MTERLQRFALIAEIAGAIAVVTSLLFVGWELRQSTRIQQIEASQSLGEDYVNALNVMAYESDAACIYVNGINGLKYLTDVEKLRFFVIWFNIFRAAEQLHNYSLEGMIDVRTWNGFQRQLKQVTRWPGVREWWDLRDYWFSEEFQSFINEMIANTEPEEVELFKPSNCND